MTKKSDHILPANEDAERVILGSIMLDNNQFYDDGADLITEDFSSDANRQIYAVINSILFGMVEGVKNADIITISNELNRRNTLQQVGGVAYLASLTESMPQRPEIAGYVRIIKDKRRLRQLMTICSVARDQAADETRTSSEIQNFLENNLIAMEADSAVSAVQIGSVTPSVEKRIKTLRTESQDRVALNMTWGIEGLDKKTKGVFGGEFTVISGESGGGKTAYMCQLSLSNAREGAAVGIFSMEMGKEQITQRFYPLMGEMITANMVRDPRLMSLHTHIPEIERLSRELQHLPIYIDDTSPIHVNRLIARIKMMKRRLGVKLFLIDYLQLIKHSERTVVDGTADIVFKLRDATKDDGEIHIVLLSQYSKSAGFTRKIKRSKEDLYGGSVIHHAAQNLFMISIEDPEKRHVDDLLDVEIYVRKQREGPTGKVPCNFDRYHLRYCYPQRADQGGT